MRECVAGETVLLESRHVSADSGPGVAGVPCSGNGQTDWIPPGSIGPRVSRPPLEEEADGI